MNTEPTTEHLVRGAVFETTDSASQAVKQLRAAGFSPTQISVICSQEHASRHFGECREETVGGETAIIPDPSAIAALGIGGTAFASAIVLSGGGALVALGAFASVTLTGTLASYFATRGVSSEAADWHEQAVSEGNLLVVVEVEHPDNQHQLKRAEEVFRQTDARLLASQESQDTQVGTYHG